MSKIGFLTDSCSDIPQELADKYGIEVVGFPINLDGTEYMERKDFTNDQFYEMMRKAQGVPTTAAITQLQFCDIYARYADEGYTDLVYLSINAGGSSTYNNAVKAMELLEEERPGYTMKIQVIDSHTYTMCYGYPVAEGARMAAAGASVEEIAAYIQDWVDHVRVLFVPFDLKFAKKSGRVSAAAAFVGEALGLKPIMTFENGASKVVTKVRGEKNVIPTILELAQKEREPGTPYLIIRAARPDQAELLTESCRQAFGQEPAMDCFIGGVIAINAGPNLVGLIYRKK